VETGILRPNRQGYSLELEGGGSWQLDVSGSAKSYAGRRVTVEGIRSGFNLIDVHDIRLAGASRRNRRPSMWERIIGG